MSVIEAAAAGFKDMADGTVRFYFDVEPRHAEDALRLFRARGTPAALAALKVGHAAVSEEHAQTSDKLKGGRLAQSAGQICEQEAFREFAQSRGFSDPVKFVHYWCSVKSRAEIDHDQDARECFRNLMAEFRLFQQVGAA